MKKSIFITGIGTEVGKTIVSAIVAEALEADYWKPIQSGDLEYSDTDKVKNLLSNSKTKPACRLPAGEAGTGRFHPNAFALKTPMSPHAAAEIDGLSIKAKKIKRPKTENILVIEGAGGLLVPLNQTETIADLIHPNDFIILVSRHYLGSINHTLMAVEILKNRGLQNIGIIFNGNENPSSESIIKKMSGIPIIGRIEEETFFDKEIIRKYAEKFKPALTDMIV